MYRKMILIVLLTFFVGFNSTYALPAKAEVSMLRNIVFPVAGNASFGDDFGDPRAGGRTHQGNDIFGRKLQPLVAVTDGVVDFVAYPEASWGFSVTVKDADGYEYNYLHINNDNPGTDDGQGDGMHAYAVDMKRGNPVVKGQLIGYMGDSGNAETTPSHLHFEIRTPSGEAINPYESLRQAERLTAPVATYPQLPSEILPYEQFSGGASAALGNIDADTSPEVVTGALAGGGPLVRTFETDGLPKHALFAYDPTFRGGVDVAVADTDGNGVGEIITSPGPGGGPHIRVFSGSGAVVSEFFAYDPRFHGGVFVAAGDVDGDGKAEIVTAPGPGGGPHVKVFRPDGSLVAEFLAYDERLHTGIDIAVIPKSSQTTGSIVTAPGPGGGPHIKVFNAQGGVVSEFFAFDETMHLGLRISAGSPRSSGGGEIAVIPSAGGGPHLKLFSPAGTETYSNFAGFETWWRGGYDVAVGGGTVFVSSAGGRRTSVREVSLTGNNNWWREFETGK